MTTRFIGLAGVRACAVILAVALGGAAFGGAWAETGAPGPWEVIAYAKPDLSGPSKTWSLAEGSPYLYVPYVGDELAGAVAAIRIGHAVGAALFQRPFFASRDTGCAPALGSDGRPDLQWLGPTARFEPGGEGMPPDAVAAPDPKTGGYASLILFRKDLGPPPGVLLMHRRRTIGSMCRNAIHKIFYNRVFLPAAQGPEAVRCFDLAGRFEVADSKEKLVFRFTSSDRFVLLNPSDLSERYAGIRHRFTVTLFDGLGCTGNPLSFKGAAGLTGSIKLDDFGFRNRTRSVRIAYHGGPLRAYLRPAEMPQAATETEGAAEPTPEPGPRPAAQPEPPPESEVQAAQAAERLAPIAPSKPEAEPAAAPKQAGEALAQPEPAAPEPTAPEPAAPEPAAPEPARPEASAPKLLETTAQPEPAAPEPARPEASAPKLLAPTAQPEPDRPAPAEAARPTAPAPEPAPAPGAIQQAMPKLEPVLLPETRVSPALASQTFQYPVHDIYRLNYCLNWNENCGEPAAHAWCKAKGFGRASDWTIDENIGSLFPTIVLGDNRVCAQFICDGFREITCGN